MSKSSTLEIKESIEELKKLIRKENKAKNILRLQSLIHIKENRFKTRSDLAAFLGYHVRTMELWLNSYKKNGVSGMLIPVDKKHLRKRCVSQDIHEALSKKLNNAEDGFLSYVDARQWVKDNFNVDYQYHTLRKYMIDFFGTKIKQPRKSHIKKSPEAQADFLKLT